MVLQEISMVYAGLKQSCGSQCLLLFLIGALAIFSSRFGPGQIQLPVLQTHHVRAIPQPFPNKGLVCCRSWMEPWFVPSCWSLDLGLSAFRLNSILALPASLLSASHSDLEGTGPGQCSEQLRTSAGNMQARGGKGLDFSSQIS